MHCLKMSVKLFPKVIAIEMYNIYSDSELAIGNPPKQHGYGYG